MILFFLCTLLSARAFMQRETIVAKFDRVDEIVRLVIDETATGAVVVVRDTSGVFKSQFFLVEPPSHAICKQMLRKLCRIIDVLGSAKITVFHTRGTVDGESCAFNATTLENSHHVASVYFDGNPMSQHFSPDYARTCADYLKEKTRRRDTSLVALKI